MLTDHRQVVAPSSCTQNVFRGLGQDCPFLVLRLESYDVFTTRSDFLRGQHTFRRTLVFVGFRGFPEFDGLAVQIARLDGYISDLC